MWNRVLGCRESVTRQLFPHPPLLLRSLEYLKATFSQHLPHSPLRMSFLYFLFFQWKVALSTSEHILLKFKPMTYVSLSVIVPKVQKKKIGIAPGKPGVHCLSILQWLKGHTWQLSPTMLEGKQWSSEIKEHEAGVSPQAAINLNNRTSEASSPRTTIIPPN